MQKYIKEVFNDYNENSNLINAIIENINLYKKTNKLQIKVASNNKIGLQEIESFEDYLVKTFKVNKASIDINYGDLQIEEEIQKDWNSIVKYIGKKEPISKAILTNSEIEVNNQNVNVNLVMKGAAFLVSQKFDKGLEHLLANLYNKSYSVEFCEKVSEDFEKKLIERRIQEEKEALIELEKQAKIEVEQAKEKKKLEAEKEKQRKLEEEERLKENLRQENPELAAKIEAHQNKLPSVKDEESPLILGRSLTIRTELVKIENIPMQEDTEMRVCVDGEVLAGSLDSRDIKDEKAILMFNIFDGTSTIGCKAFLPREKAKESKGRISKAKGLRIEGLARYSTYSREVEIMANTIIESTGFKKEKRIDDAEIKRVELHRSEERRVGKECGS